MNTPYIIRRLAWRWLPALIDLRLYLKHIPKRRGLETLKPQAAVDRYLAALDEIEFSLQGKRIFILGYGGSFAVACKLLVLGAQHVSLYDPYRTPDSVSNRKLVGEYSEYLDFQNGQVIPRAPYITVLDQELSQIASDPSIEPFDLVFSSSVFEHVEDVDGVVDALSRLTDAAGLGVHFIDLQDHLYSYPFEMLCYSSTAWSRFLNPHSHLNRYRLFDFRRIFSSYFSQVAITIENKDEQSFQQIADRIQPEFKSGNLPEDSATFIKALTGYPQSKLFEIQLPEKIVSYEVV